MDTQPTADSHRPSSNRRTLGLVSIALGVLGLVSALVEPTIALLLGLIGLFLALLAWQDTTSRRIALLGIVSSAVVLVLVTAIATNVFP